MPASEQAIQGQHGASASKPSGAAPPGELPAGIRTSCIRRNHALADHQPERPDSTSTSCYR